MKKIAVIYHKNCSDGFGGAWAAWKKFGRTADFIGLEPSDKSVTNFKNKEIYFIDRVYSADLIKRLIKTNKRVTAIDHHVTSEVAVKLTEKYSYAVRHSGAVLAWRYFHPKKAVPKILRHIEDIDLWKFKIPHTKEIAAYLDLYDFDFKAWDKLAADMEKAGSRRKIIEKGEVIRRYEDKRVERLVQEAALVRFAGYKTLAVNSPNLRSEIGAALLKKLPPIAVIWDQKSEKKIFSLRSNGKVDVAKIAERFGGGGHKTAAGFSLPANQKLPWKLYSKTKK